MPKLKMTFTNNTIENMHPGYYKVRILSIGDMKNGQVECQAEVLERYPNTYSPN